MKEIKDFYKVLFVFILYLFMRISSWLSDSKIKN